MSAPRRISENYETARRFAQDLYDAVRDDIVSPEELDKSYLTLGSNFIDQLDAMAIEQVGLVLASRGKSATIAQREDVVRKKTLLPDSSSADVKRDVAMDVVVTRQAAPSMSLLMPLPPLAPAQIKERSEKLTSEAEKLTSHLKSLLESSVSEQEKLKREMGDILESLKRAENNGIQSGVESILAETEKKIQALEAGLAEVERKEQEAKGNSAEPEKITQDALAIKAAALRRNMVTGMKQ